MKLKRRWYVAALALSIGMPIDVTLAETTEATSEPTVAPVVDEKADSILRQMSDFLAAQKGFRLHTVRNFDLVLDNGIKIQTESSAEVAVQRPSGIHIVRHRVDFDQHVYYNGKELTFYRSTGLYASAAAPATIDEFLDRAIDNLSLVPPSADLLYSDPYKVLTEDRIAGVYVGVTRIDDANCHHLFFRNKNVDWQIWIEDGERPLPRKMVITAGDEEQSPQFQARFTNWELNPSFAADEFNFVAPADSVRIGIANADALPAN